MEHINSLQSEYPPRYTAKTDVFALGLILAELCVVIKNDEERYEVRIFLIEEKFE